MSGLPVRASEVHEGAPPCPVHPYGFHQRAQVREEGARTVFRPAPVHGLPARCALLEEELMESERELDLLDELWRREHAAPGHGLAILGVTVTVAVVVALVLTGVATAGVVLATLAGGLAVVGLDRADRALHDSRLARVRDWHRRVGTPR
ncbi:hypothetical protein [Demequina phytophila]|uniref:hypothetical protein n=1 Tax=Demequina phytophila TaxID=1638981 RepID=UPI00078103CF|nr:hypothetical protein [Demequina phytophila]